MNNFFRNRAMEATDSSIKLLSYGGRDFVRGRTQTCETGGEKTDSSSCREKYIGFPEGIRKNEGKGEALARWGRVFGMSLPLRGKRGEPQVMSLLLSEE